MSCYVYPITESNLMQAVLTYRILVERKSQIEDLLIQCNLIEANMQRQLKARGLCQNDIDKLLDDRPEKNAITDVLKDITKDVKAALRKIYLTDYDISDEDPSFRGYHRDVSFRGFTGIPCPICHTMQSFKNGICAIDGTSQYIDGYEESQVKGNVVHPKQRRCAIM